MAPRPDGTAPRDTAPAFPLMERPLTAATLAGVAGLLNGWTFMHTHAFATVQSGNLITLGVGLVDRDRALAAMAAASILAFGIGVGASELLQIRARKADRSYSTWALLVETALLVILTLLALVPRVAPEPIALGISVVAGVQGTAFHRDRGMIYGNVAVTLVVQMAASHLVGGLASGRAGGAAAQLRTAALYGGVLVAFAGGASVATLLDRVWISGALVAAAATTCAVALVVWRRSVDVDPLGNG